MSQMVRAGLVQTKGYDTKQENIDKAIFFAEKAASKDVQIISFQELFFAPYFAAEQDPQWFNWAEKIPGPTVKIMQDFAKKHKMVMIVPVFEEVGRGVYYNTAAVINIDGEISGLYRKSHLPHLKGFWEKYYFKPSRFCYLTR